MKPLQMRFYSNREMAEVMGLDQHEHNFSQKAKRKLEIQQHDAEWWRDACVGYFQTFSKRPLPSDVRPLRLPIDSLEFHQLKSDELGMPVFEHDLRVVILPPRRMMRRPQ